MRVEIPIDTMIKQSIKDLSKSKSPFDYSRFVVDYQFLSHVLENTLNSEYEDHIFNILFTPNSLEVRVGRS